MQALNSNVGQLLPYLNIGTWRDAPAGTRVSEMQNLVGSMPTDDSSRKISSMAAAREDEAGGDASPYLSMQDWARVFSQPLVQVLINKLALLHVEADTAIERDT